MTTRPRIAAYLLTVGGLLVLLNAGPVFAHEGYNELIASGSKAVEERPSDPALRFELASLHAQHRDLELALQNLDRVDALAPGKYLTDFVRGEAFFAVRDSGRAKQALDRQLVSRPGAAPALLLRARAERELGQQTASLADYREALKGTASPEPDLVQEVSSALAANGKKEEAAGVLAAGIARLGKIPSLVLRAIDLEIETKKFDAALRRIEQAQRDAPRPEPWMARRAAVLAQAGRVEESRAAWRELLEHLASLPDHERTSQSMSNLTDEARAALASL
jgi:predicted Zn-dependent protease